MISIGSNFLFFSRPQSAHALVFALSSCCIGLESFAPIIGISLSELSKMHSISSLHGGRGGGVVGAVEDTDVSAIGGGGGDCFWQCFKTRTGPAG